MIRLFTTSAGVAQMEATKPEHIALIVCTITPQGPPCGSFMELLLLASLTSLAPMELSTVDFGDPSFPLVLQLFQNMLVLFFVFHFSAA